ncbi:MAG TPA: hypothetical protein VGF40_10455 [Thermoanaerobaculia bacterium]
MRRDFGGENAACGGKCGLRTPPAAANADYERRLRRQMQNAKCKIQKGVTGALTIDGPVATYRIPFLNLSFCHFAFFFLKPWTYTT